MFDDVRVYDLEENYMQRSSQFGFNDFIETLGFKELEEVKIYIKSQLKDHFEKLFLIEAELYRRSTKLEFVSEFQDVIQYQLSLAFDNRYIVDNHNTEMLMRSLHLDFDIKGQTNQLENLKTKLYETIKIFEYQIVLKDAVKVFNKIFELDRLVIIFNEDGFVFGEVVKYKDTYYILKNIKWLGGKNNPILCYNGQIFADNRYIKYIIDKFKYDSKKDILVKLENHSIRKNILKNVMYNMVNLEYRESLLLDKLLMIISKKSTIETNKEDYILFLFIEIYFNSEDDYSINWQNVYSIIAPKMSKETKTPTDMEILNMLIKLNLYEKAVKEQDMLTEMRQYMELDINKVKSDLSVVDSLIKKIIASSKKRQSLAELTYQEELLLGAFILGDKFNCKEVNIDFIRVSIYNEVGFANEVIFFEPWLSYSIETIYFLFNKRIELEM